MIFTCQPVLPAWTFVFPNNFSIHKIHIIRELQLLSYKGENF
nr:MAG TPA: hypothetical protein [Caudoviricetes sp.]